MAQVFANNASSTLSAQLLIGATSMSLSDASRFPTPASGDYYLATLVGLNSNGQEDAWEIVRVTGKSGSTLTIVRAQEGTSASLWAAGTRVELRFTAGSLTPPWTLVRTAASPVTVTAGSNYLADPNTGPVTLNLPAGSAGMTVRVKASSIVTGVNYVRLNPSGVEVIAGLTGGEPLDVDQPFVDFVLVYNTTLGWVV